MPLLIFNTFSNLIKNPTKLWSYVNYTSGKTQSIPSLRDSNGDATDDSSDKAELRNTAFRNTFTTEDEAKFGNLYQEQLSAYVIYK